MKKIILWVLLSVFSVMSYAQDLIPLRSKTTLIGNFTYYGLNKMEIGLDSLGNYYLILTKQCISPGQYIFEDNFEGDAFNDFIKKRKHLYIKLDNDSIIILTCIKYDFTPVNYELQQWGKGLEYMHTTKISTIFRLNKEIIDCLQTHKIIKLRLELVNKFVDIEEGSKSNFFSPFYIQKVFSHIEKMFEEYKTEKEKEREYIETQEKIKDNPLYGF